MAVPDLISDPRRLTTAGDTPTTIRFAAKEPEMSVAEFFTITPGTQANTLVVEGTVGRYTDMRTVWLEETPGHFVALDNAGNPVRDWISPALRVTVEWDAATSKGWLGMFTTAPNRFLADDRDETLARATVELAD